MKPDLFHSKIVSGQQDDENKGLGIRSALGMVKS